MQTDAWRTFVLVAAAIVPQMALAAGLLHSRGGMVPPLPSPVFDAYPTPAPAAYGGVIKMRSAYSGPALRLALGSTPATQQDFGWITNARGVQVVDDAAVQTWLNASSTYGCVVTVYDQSGSGLNFTSGGGCGVDAPLYKGVQDTHFPAPNNTTTLREWLGLPSINFWARNTNAGSKVFLNIPSGVVSNRQNASAMLATTLNDSRPIDVVQTQQLLVLLGATAPQLLFNDYQNHIVYSDQSTVVASAITPSIDWHVTGFTADATNICTWDDKVSGCNANTFTAASLAGGFWSGGSTNNSYDGDSTALIVWGSALTSQQYADRREALKAQLGIAADPQYLIVFDGDSITEAITQKYGEGWPRRAISRVWVDKGIRVRAYNVGYSSACLGAASGCTYSPDSLTSQFNIKTKPVLAQSGYTKSVLFTFAGTNDIYFGQTPATTSGYWTTYENNAKSAVPGVKVIFGGMISRVNFDAACYTYVNTVVPAGNFDEVSGWWNDASMGCKSSGGTNYNNTTYFAGDQTHPTNLGYDVGSGYAATAIESQIP